MNNSHRMRMLILSAVVIAMWTTAVYAQDLEKGQIEATGQVGVVTGIGTHSYFGGSIGTGATNHIFAVGEFSYIPLGSANVATTGVQASGSGRGYLFNFMGQYHLRRAGSQFAPYGGAGLGVLHSSSEFKSTVNG